MSQFDGKFPTIVSYDIARKLPIVTSLKGEPKEGYYFKEIRLSSGDVSLIGSKELLDSLSKINGQSIDITDLSASFTTNLSLILPENTSLLVSTPITADVIIEPLTTRLISIPSSLVTIYESDTTGAKEYSLLNNAFNISIEGKPDLIQNLKLSDIRCNISVKDLDIGEHLVPVTIALPGGISLKEDVSVTVIIVGSSSQETTPTPSPTPVVLVP